jgi:S-adenosyl methyltransferase
VNLPAGAPGFDVTRPHPARMYDYYLGGKDHYQADRDAAEKIVKVAPEIVDSARANRYFLGRAVRYLTEDKGIRQFLDIGTGIPAAGNTHEVAQALAPDARVAYADNDRCKSGCVHALSRSGCLHILFTVH